MNVLLTLMKPDAMGALLQQTWPGLVDALCQELGRPSQHMWMVMGCVRTVLQVLGAQVQTLAQSLARSIASHVQLGVKPLAISCLQEALLLVPWC